MILSCIALIWYNEIDVRWIVLKPHINTGKLFTKHLPPSPKFAIIMNTESCLREHQRKYFGNATSCDCHVFILSYKTPCNDTSLKHVHYFHQKVSFSPGRNIGFYEARKTKHNFLYYIFLDDDVHLVFNKYTPKEIKNEGSSFKVFTKFLLDYEPAGAVANAWDNYGNELKYCNKTNKIPFVVTIIWFDAMFNAFHRDTVDILLPLYNIDSKSAWLSQMHVIYNVKVAFYGQFVRFPYITAVNPMHRAYKRGLYYEDKQLHNSIINDIKSRTPYNLRNYSVFEHLNHSPKQIAEDGLCIPPPKPKSKIIPYKTMFSSRK